MCVSGVVLLCSACAHMIAVRTGARASIPLLFQDVQVWVFFVAVTVSDAENVYFDSLCRCLRNLEDAV